MIDPTNTTATSEERRDANISILRGLENGSTYRRIKSLPALEDLLILKKLVKLVLICYVLDQRHRIFVLGIRINHRHSAPYCTGN